MARFTASIASLLALSLQRRAAPQAPSERPASATADDLSGPGWFDSSWDLRRGLEVSEGLPDDAGLQEWLEASCLRAPAAEAVATA